MLEAIWTGVILLCLVMYVVLDGYDLGIGIASMFERDKKRKHQMIEAVVSNWDGNETWLILLAVSLWAGFPMAFGILLPYVYLPGVIMLFALIVRGAGLELVSSGAKGGAFWTWMFGVGSLVAALAQGFMLGALVNTVAVKNGIYVGDAFDFMTLFSVIAAATLTIVYVSLGLGYLQYKIKPARSKYRSQDSISHGRAFILLAGVLLLLVCVLVDPASLLADASLVHKAGFWFLVALGEVAILVAAGYFKTKKIDSEVYWEDRVPFGALTVAVVAFALAFVVIRYPMIVPNLTLHEAISPDISVNFLVIFVAMLNIPLVLFYNWFSHHTFRGTIGERSGGTTPNVDSEEYYREIVKTSEPIERMPKQSFGRVLVRILVDILLIALATVLYMVSINIFGFDEAWHIATWIAVVSMSLFALGVWIIDDRRRGAD